MMPTSAISGHHKGGLSQVEIPADFQADSSKSGSRFEFSPQQMNYENSKIEAVRLIKDLQLLLLERAPLLNDVTDDGLQLPMHLVKFLHSSGKEVLKHRRKFLEVRSWQTSGEFAVFKTNLPSSNAKKRKSFPRKFCQFSEPFQDFLKTSALEIFFFENKTILLFIK